MPGALLIGYDVERIPRTGAGREVGGGPACSRGRNPCLSSTTPSAIHRETQVPATLFMVGCNIEKHLPQLEACLASGYFEIAQHTYEHYPLKTVVEESPENVYLPGLPFDRIEEQLARPVELLARHLGVECRGVTAPYCYYRGLSDRPDILEIVARLGIPTSAPTVAIATITSPWDGEIQPFWYTRQGFPSLLEIPIQGWIERTMATRPRLEGLARLPHIPAG